MFTPLLLSKLSFVQLLVELREHGVLLVFKVFHDFMPWYQRQITHVWVIIIPGKKPQTVLQEHEPEIPG